MHALNDVLDTAISYIECHLFSYFPDLIPIDNSSVLMA